MYRKPAVPVALSLLGLLVSASSARAIHSYADVVTVLHRLASVAENSRLEIVQIGTTVKGRAIVMAVLHASHQNAATPFPQLETLPQEPQPEAPGADASSDTPTLVLERVTRPGSRPEPRATECEGDSEENEESAGAPEVLPLLPTQGAPVRFGTDDRPARLLILCRQHGNEPAPTEAAMRLLAELATTS
ncbi:MAG: hypothetical protein QHJ73_11880, partial [Armatimonadota bacterium]|nr:hypothetical protein [Armatimonadota bacterium]